MRIIIFLIAFSLVGCATQAQTAKEFAFDNWVHHTDEKYDVELVYSNKNPNKTIIFIVDHNITCDARLVFFNKDLEEDYLSLLNGERFDFSLAGQSYEDNDGGLFNTNGYTRFELLSFYKHHFHQLEELLAPKGYIDFQLSDPLSRFEKQDMQFPVSGLNQALDHALDTCQGWT